MSKNLPKIILVIVAVAIVGVITYLESQKASTGSFVAGEANIDINLNGKASLAEKLKQYETAKEIVAPAGFINTAGQEINIQELIGKKVILVDFWTYSCINCQRTLPYLTSWYEKYKDQGLEIIGMHTPEFEFEKDIDNVQQAVDKWGVGYPVVLDNDFGTWRNYNNRYWPHKYLIDIDGFIVYDHIGEGAYEQTEQKIQELLQERMTVLNMKDEVSSGIVNPQNIESVDVLNKRSPEIYFGALRNIDLGNGKEGSVGMQNLSIPSAVKKHTLYLDGSWDIQSEFAKNQEPEARIIFKYQAEKVFMVASADQDVVVEILIDGQPINIPGADVVDGSITINQDRLYRLVEDPVGNSSHTLEIIIKNAGLKAFTFTFG